MSDISKNDSLLRIGTVLKKTYRIDKHLSSGGFGNTYVATNVEFEEVVAIKEFFIRGVTERDANNTTVSVSNTENKTLFEEQKQKFKKEARRLRKLKNAHIVTVHDLFEENGTAYYVMDYIDGENLSVRLKRLQQALSEKEVMGYLPQILDALECVHREGLCHLDLKPANIMVDGKENAILIDFGASKQCSYIGGNTTITAVSYTNGFAPREQMEQNLEKLGPWTDLYALGATLYNLLTNRKPPLPSDIDDDRSPDKHLALPMPSSISEHFKQIILRLMKTDRFDRPQSIAALRLLMEQSDDDSQTYILPSSTNDILDVLEENTRVKGEDPSSNGRIGDDVDFNGTKHSPSRKRFYGLIIFLIVIAGVGYFVNFLIQRQKVEEHELIVRDSIAQIQKIEQARLDSIEKNRKAIEQARLDSIEQARQVEEEFRKEIERMVTAYIYKIDEVGYIDNYNSNGYFLFDITHDGLPELWIKNGTCEADRQLDVYTYNNELKHIFQQGAGHTTFCQGKNYILQWYIHAEGTICSKISYNNGKFKCDIIYEKKYIVDDSLDLSDNNEPKEPIVEMHSFNDKRPIRKLLNL